MPLGSLESDDGDSVELRTTRSPPPRKRRRYNAAAMDHRWISPGAWSWSIPVPFHLYPYYASMTSHAAFAPFYLPAHPHYFAPASVLLPPPPLLLSQWKPVKNPAFLSVESLIAKSECVDPPEDEEEEEEEEEELSVCLTPPPPPPPAR